MGVCDFVCFVQRNGQNLVCLEPRDPGDPEESDEEADGRGSGTAVLVRVPVTVSRRDILAWELADFAAYPRVEAAYGWDGCEFDSASGYSDAPLSSDSWWEGSIWASPDFPGEWLVNFEPGAFDAFVLKKISPAEIPWWYLKEVFENRRRELPETKEEACRLVADSRDANLWEHDGSRYEPLTVPAEYARALTAVALLPVFAGACNYLLREPPPELSKARLAVFLGNEVQISDPDLSGLLHVDPPFQFGAGAPRLGYRGWAAAFEFRFRPASGVRVASDLLWGCLEPSCLRPRDTGSYFCLGHHGGDLAPARARAEEAIRAEAERLMPVCDRLLAEARPPPLLVAEFNEKGKPFRLELERDDSGCQMYEVD